MSSYESGKKRKADGHQGSGDCESNAATDEGGKTSLAAILAEMKDMKSEMNDMNERLSRMDELDSKCNKLEAKCDSLERSMQILIKEQKWEYSAPSIPSSYWVDLGFDGDYIEGMEYLLRQLKESTIMLRGGKNIHQQYIELSGGFEDEDDDTILLHEDILLPHWKEFVNALQLYHNSGCLLNLYIYNVQLTSSVIGLLATAVAGKQILKLFELASNEFVNTREGIDLALEIVESNPNLEKFHWMNNPIGSMDDARHLVEAITIHPRIHHIRLENCFGNDINGYDVLRPLFTSGRSFSHIDLEKNNIRTGGGNAISDYLATNPPLSNLYLAGNHLNDDDAVLIARALKQNNNLQYLDLGDNDLAEKGKNALSNAIYDPTSLNSVLDCNHSCYICGNGIHVNPANHPYIASKVSRAKKIYQLLSLRNREGNNVQHLNVEFDDEDGSLALVPNVLASVQQYCDMAGYNNSDEEVHPLSIMYEILRGWKIPELYENSGVSNKVS